MTVYSVRPEATRAAIESALGEKIKHISIALGEVTVQVAADDYLAAAVALRDAPDCQFEQLLDLCGVDYSEYPAGSLDGQRYGVVSHLLSVSLNQRLRLKVFAPNDDMPVVSSVMDIWNSANWFEREAFDLSYPDRLWFYRPSVPQRLSDIGPRRDAIRRRAGTRGLPTRFD
jgi:NADH-quinone oxidoreductase subunit C